VKGKKRFKGTDAAPGKAGIERSVPMKEKLAGGRSEKSSLRKMFEEIWG